MVKQLGTKIVFSGLTILAILAAGCGASATATARPTPIPTPIPTEAVATPEPPAAVAAPGIVDPSNLGWPRLVSTKRGNVEITSRPQAVVTPSLGHSEILVALVDSSRVVGISRHSYNPDASNIVKLAERMPDRSTTRDVEKIIVLNPDLVIVSSFAKAEFVEQLETVGITVVQTEFEDRISAIGDNVRLMAYILGEVGRGEAIVEEVQRRMKFIEDTVGVVPDEERPGVMMLGYLSKWTGGSETSNEDIISLAGGINLPGRAFEGFQEIGIEGIVDMNPQVMVLSADEVRKNDAMNVLLDNPGLLLVDAISNQQVYGVERKYLYNLSHWRVRGVEEVAKILWPDKFAGVEFPDFQIGPQ